MTFLERRTDAAGAALAAAFACAWVLTCSGSGCQGTEGLHGPLAFGAPCNASSECQSGQCAPYPFAPYPTLDAGARGECTHSCNGDPDCLAGWACTPVPGAPSVCECAPAGERCDGLDNDCNGIIDDPGPANASCGGGAVCTNGACTCAPGATPLVPGTPLTPNGDPTRVDVGVGCCAQDRRICADPISGQPTCADTTSDSANCGACGAACDPLRQTGATCVASACRCGHPPTATSPACPPTPGNACADDDACHASQQLAFGWQYTISDVAVASGKVLYRYTDFYVTAGVMGPFVGTATVAPDPTARSLSSVFATEGADYVYAADAATDAGAGFQLWACPGGTCGKTPLAFVPTFSLLALEGGVVYFLAGASLMQCALSGCGGAPTLVRDAPGTVHATADLHNAYLANAGGDLVVAPLDGSAPTTLAQKQDVLAMASDGATLYWATSTGIYACKAAGCGGAPTTLVTTPMSGVTMNGFLVDDKDVYFTRGALFRCGKSGCAAPQKLSGGFDGPIAADATNVYCVAKADPATGTPANALIGFSKH